MGLILNSDEQSRFGYSVETVFGTAIADNGAFKEVFFPKGVFIDPAVTVSDLDLNRASRIQELDDLFVDNFSGPVTLRAPELLLSRDRAADFLYSVCQNKVSEAVGTPYQKVFKMNASQPDFLTNAGFFFTLGWRGPVSAKHLKVTSCIVKELTISIDKSGTGDSTLVRFTDIVILGKKIAEASTFSGAWTAQGTNRLNAYDFTFKYNDATALPITKFKLKIDNGAKPGDRDTDGTPKTWFLDPPKTNAVVADFETWYDADSTGTVVDLMANHRAGTKVLYSITNSVATDVVDHLKIQVRGKINNNPQAASDRQMKVPVTLACGNDGVSDALIIDYADAIDQTP